MKHKNNRKHKYNDVAVMQAIIDMLKDSNVELQAEVTRLKNEIDLTNANNIQQDEDDKNYKNLSQLNTLLLILMNLATAYCNDSPLGNAVAKAIKKYHLTMGKSLTNTTRFIKDEDFAEWDDEDGEDESTEIWRGEEE